jgi:transposase-like protein
MENINKGHIIKCPYCNREYFPAEIFMPKSFIGTAFHISETLYVGNDMELSESYTCDSCNSSFNVEAEVTFKVSKTEFGNFDEIFTQNSL